jgi:hypothetical protein
MAQPAGQLQRVVGHASETTHLGLYEEYRPRRLQEDRGDELVAAGVLNLVEATSIARCSRSGKSDDLILCLLAANDVSILRISHYDEFLVPREGR